MNSRILCTLAALLVSVALCPANIISANLADDGDGVITCTAQFDQAMSTVSVSGQHNLFTTGHILGNITTDTELDPTLWIVHGLDNDTAFIWTDYHAQITLDKQFTIVGVVAPSDWSWAITPPSQVGNQWIGTVDYYAGTPIAIGGTIQMGYVMNFAGSVSLCEALTPTTVPEPSVIAFGLCGLVGWLVRRRRSA